jgi:putative endonuclease
MTDKIKKGKDGEAKAEKFLEEKGYEIVRRNYRFKRSEVDLIVKKENWLVFVEVKMRTSSAFGHPEEAINSAKRKKVMEGAAQYLIDSDWQGNVRYDVVAIYRKEIVHFEDAFY